MSDSQPPDVEKTNQQLFDSNDSSSIGLKTEENGIILIPQPSDDDRDPLVRFCSAFGRALDAFHPVVIPSNFLS